MTPLTFSSQCRRNFIAIVTAFLLTSLSAVSAYACPAINGIVDFNCDGVVKIFFVGDSFVYGFGDTINKNKGGYVTRLAKALPNVSVERYGVQGLRAVTLVKTATDTFSAAKPYPEFRKSLDEADIIILDIGRNDRWLRGAPSKTYRDLERITTIITNGVKSDTGFAPLIVKSVLMLPNRGSQGPWVSDLNTLILGKSTDALPGDLRFDLVSKKLIGSDQIHPTSAGYTAIAKTFMDYRLKLKRHCVADQLDSDNDGIPDIYETNKFFTNPFSADTDGDLKSDSAEIFTLHTNPLVAD